MSIFYGYSLPNAIYHSLVHSSQSYNVKIYPFIFISYFIVKSKNVIGSPVFLNTLYLFKYFPCIIPEFNSYGSIITIVSSSKWYSIIAFLWHSLSYEDYVTFWVNYE